MTRKELAIEYRTKYPDKPSLALARIMYNENKLSLKNVEDARQALRYIEGKSGSAKRKYVQGTEFVKEEARPYNPYNLPESDEVDFKPYVIKGFKRVGIMSDCIPVDSEVLTKDGWVPLSEVSVGDEIMASDESANLYFSPVLNKVGERIDDVFTFKRGSIRFQFTKNHRHLYFAGGRKLATKTTDQLHKNVSVALKATGIKIDGNQVDNRLLKLIGFCIGDGTRDSQNWKISVKKGRKIKYLDSLFDDSDMTRNVNGDYVIYRLRVELTGVIDQFIINKKKDLNWSKFLSLDSESINDVLDGIINSDGCCKEDRPNIHLSAVRANHIKFFQTLNHLVGNCCTWGHVNDNSRSTFPSDNPLYGCTKYKSKEGCYYGAFLTKTEKKMVSCLTVKGSYFLVRQNNNIIITGNCHLPYHNIPALSAALDYLKKDKVDALLLNGDTLDCHQLSRFVKDPKKRGFKGELDTFKQFFDVLEKELKCKIFFKIGNHEKRYEIFLQQKAGELIGVEEFTFDSIIKARARGVEIIGDKTVMKLNALNGIHGHEYLGGIAAPVNVARGLYLKGKVSAFQGHNHSTSEHSETDMDGKITTTWSIGCLCELHPEYLPLNKWNTGFAIVDLDSNGVDYEFRNKRIYKGKVL